MNRKLATASRANRRKLRVWFIGSRIQTTPRSTRPQEKGKGQRAIVAAVSVGINGADRMPRVRRQAAAQAGSPRGVATARRLRPAAPRQAGRRPRRVPSPPRPPAVAGRGCDGTIRAAGASTGCVPPHAWTPAWKSPGPAAHAPARWAGSAHENSGRRGDRCSCATLRSRRPDAAATRAAGRQGAWRARRLRDQALAALGTAGVEDLATVGGGHAGTEAVGASALELAGLEGPLHGLAPKGSVCGLKGWK